jgi:transcriptional regulator with XRE-family HTH domain
MLGNLKVALRERNFSQDQMAEILGLSRATMSRVVSGERELERELRDRSAEILHADQQWLFTPVRVVARRAEAPRLEPEPAMAAVRG